VLPGFRLALQAVRREYTGAEDQQYQQSKDRAQIVGEITAALAGLSRGDTASILALHR
jgi:hypothetical protein